MDGKRPVAAADKGNLGLEELEVSDLLPDEAGGQMGVPMLGSSFRFWVLRCFSLFYDLPPNSELLP